MAFALTGFAALHMLTRGLKNRALWLGSAYALVTFLVWPIAAIVVLGLADSFFDLRHRFAHRLPPPSAAA
jgi:nitrate/nitrite transporter NarK